MFDLQGYCDQLSLVMADSEIHHVAVDLEVPVPLPHRRIEEEVDLAHEGVKLLQIIGLQFVRGLEQDPVVVGHVDAYALGDLMELVPQRQHAL